MKIAMPVYGNRVMPRFGCTRKIIVVIVEDGSAVATQELTLAPGTLTTLPGLLASEQVSILICGGIHPRFQQMFQAHGIRLIWGVIGDWRDVLQAYLQGTLQTDPAFCLHPGYRQRVRLRGRQHRRK